MMKKLAVLSAFLLAVTLTSLWAQEPEPPAPSAAPVAATAPAPPAPEVQSQAPEASLPPAPPTVAHPAVPRTAATPQAAPPTPPPPPREEPSWNFYRLDYVVRELDGDRTVNSRSFSLSVQDRRWQELRISSSVPVATSSRAEVLFSVDAQPREHEGQVAVETRFEVRSLPEIASNESLLGPLARTWRGSSTALVVPGKPTVIAVSDDPGSKHRFELEVTATRIK